MPRPRVPPLDRLRHRFWAHSLRAEVARKARAKEAGDSARPDLPWAKLGRLLIDKSTKARQLVPRDWRFQGLHGVAAKGDDPRRVVIRVAEGEMEIGVPSWAKAVTRRKSGRKSGDDHEHDRLPLATGTPQRSGRKFRYAELPLDLIELGELVCPGSSKWEVAPLWAFASEYVPGLEEIRLLISKLMQKLDLIAPTIEEHRPYVSASQYEVLAASTNKDKISRYKRSLLLLSERPDAYSTSLLAALVAESFIIDNDVLLDLHRTAFDHAIRQIFADQLMVGVKDQFESIVVSRILGLGWEMPATWHVSSIEAPLIMMDQWRQISKIWNWVRL